MAFSGIEGLLDTQARTWGLEWRRSRFADAVGVLCHRPVSLISSKTLHVLQPAASEIPFRSFTDSPVDRRMEEHGAFVDGQS